MGVVARIAVVYLVDGRGHVLLQHRDEHAPRAADQWGIVGGHVEDGEDPDAAVHRELEEETGIVTGPGDLELWLQTYAEPEPEHELDDGDILQIGDVDIEVIHTPGHSPGAVCFHVPSLGVLFSGDTLFNGGPGATGRSFSDFGTIIDSFRDRLLTLPPETVGLTGHGESTTIGAEAPHLQEWIDRGH